MDDLVTARLVLHPMNVIEAERVVAGQPDVGARWAPGYPGQGIPERTMVIRSRSAHTRSVVVRTDMPSAAWASTVRRTRTAESPSAMA
jgi:hypothetical protein